jgi:PiT family inorganic phosphate transporter
MLNRPSKMSLFFGGLLLAATVYFMVWGLDHTGHAHVALFVLATLSGLFMAFSTGGNDVANSFGTSAGAGTLSLRQALSVAAIFEVSGAMIAGGQVTETIRSGILDLSAMPVEPREFAYIMMAALLAVGVWLLYATRMGYPASTTHSIVGLVVGSSIALGTLTSGPGGALALVNWGEIVSIALS